MTTREVASAYRLSQWAASVQERAAEGESIVSYCRKRGISQNTYYYWQRKLRTAACEQLSPFAPATLSTPRFAEVCLTDPGALPPSSDAGRPGQLSISIGDIRVTADSGYPAGQLAILLRELTRPC